MDRKALIGFILMGIVVVFWVYLDYNKRIANAEQDAIRIDSLRQVAYQDSIIEANKPKAITPITTNTNDTSKVKNSNDSSKVEAQPVKRTGYFANAFDGDEAFKTIENDLIKLNMSNKGGRIYTAELKNFKAYNGNELVLFDGPNNNFEYVFDLNDNKTYNTRDLFFEPKSATTNSITYQAKVNGNAYLQQTYTLNNGSYLVDYDLQLVGFDDVAREREVNLNLLFNTNLNRQEKGIKYERQYSTIAYRELETEDVERLKMTGKGEVEESATGSVEWVAHKDQFFNIALINKSEDGFYKGDFTTSYDEEDELYSKNMKSKLTLNASKASEIDFPMQFYVGPNDFKELKKLDLGMQDIFKLGYLWIDTKLNKYFIIPLFHFLEGLGIKNYGIIILILTFIVKLLVFPLTYKSYLSSAKMRVLKPELDALKEKYGKDAQKLQVKQMELYKKTGVNMFGGCLPMILQMPLWIAMYRFFPASIELRQKSFLWAEDLSTFDSVLSLPFEIPMYGAHVSLFTLLMAASQILYIKYGPSAQMSMNSPQAGQMKIIQYVMPIFLLVFFNSFSSGLTAYILFSNLITFGQQFVANKFLIDDKKLLAQIEANKKKPMKKGGFQAKMAEAMKRQQEMQKKKGKR